MTILLSPLSYALMLLLMSITGAGAVLTSVRWTINFVHSQQAKWCDRRDAVYAAERAYADQLMTEVAHLEPEWQMWALGNAIAWGNLPPSYGALFDNPEQLLLARHWEELLSA